MRLGAMLTAALCLVALWTAAWPFTIDDAWIAARYAVRLAHGHGYTFNEGSATDGVTGPLWLAPLALVAWLRLDVMVAAKLLGALSSGIALLWVMGRLGKRALGNQASWVALAVGVTSLPFVVWAVAGLETGLAGLCATWLALAVRGRPRPAPFAAGIAFGALAWLRPELLALALVLLVGLLLRAPRAGLRAGWVAAACVLALIALRYWLFGRVLPMSVAAKPALLEHGLAYVGGALMRPRAWIAALLVGASMRSATRDDGLLALALLAQLLALVLAGGDWMPGLRLFAPLTPLFSLLIASTWPRLMLRLCARSRTRRRAWLASPLIALVAVSASELVRTLPEVRAAGLNQRARMPTLARAVCAESGPVAMVDVGAPGFACVTQPLIDLAGLTEPQVAYARGGHLAKHVDGRWLEALAPSLIVLHSRARPRVDEAGRLRWFAGYPVERRVLSLPWVQRGYRVRGVIPYAPDYHYVLLGKQR